VQKVARLTLAQSTLLPQRKAQQMTTGTISMTTETSQRKSLTSTAPTALYLFLQVRLREATVLADSGVRAAEDVAAVVAGQVRDRARLRVVAGTGRIGIANNQRDRAFGAVFLFLSEWRS
jgi:hypothetical protein